MSLLDNLTVAQSYSLPAKYHNGD